MRAALLSVVLAAPLVLGACSVTGRPAASPGAPVDVPGAVTIVAADAAADADHGPLAPTLVIAPAVREKVNEGLVRSAFERVVDQGKRDFGLTPKRSVSVYVDPDSAIGLEDALGLAAGNAMHLRAGRTQRMDLMLPLMMHEYTHVLQHQIGRLRPQWWIEGQADHQSWRVLSPAQSEMYRRALFRQLAADIRAGRAPALADLRGNTGWDNFVKHSGAGRAYGWGNAAVHFIEEIAGFDAVTRIMTDATGPNTMSSFDEAVQRETGLAPAEFDAALKEWLLKQASTPS
jgi:hypothetical protein